MKIADSGMPDEAYWNSLFDIATIMAWLPAAAEVVEIGCGYGSFTLPLAKKISGTLYAFDIDNAMLDIAQRNARNAGLSNVLFSRRDVLEDGTGLAAASADLVLLFNILHFSERSVLLAEAERLLKKDGVVAIIHWRTDIPTPRGPAVALRPDWQQILADARGLKLALHGSSELLPPYHWGMQLRKV